MTATAEPVSSNPSAGPEGKAPVPGGGVERVRASGPRHPGWAPYFFILPFLVVFCTFVVYPLFQSLVLSTKITAGPDLSRFIGLDNFRILAGDDLFWKALGNTAFFAAGSLLTQMPCALGLALLLNQKKLRGRAFFRLVFFSPYLMGLIFVGLLVNLMLAPNTGLVDTALHKFTSLITFNQYVWPLNFAWLVEHTRPALVLCALWVYTGFNMIYFLAALQNVSPELLEAAQVDGAGPWRRFWHVTLPSIRPVASYIALLSLLGSFQLFELPFILFISSGETGPKDQGVTIVMYLYQYAFERGNLGRACALGWVLAILLMLFAVGYRVVTQGEEK